MNNVREFKPKPAPLPVGTVSGAAFCIACNHEWHAVMLDGVGEPDPQLECPSCHARRGRWKFDFAPPAGSCVRECQCGGQLFYIRPEGHQCPRCGTFQEYD